MVNFNITSISEHFIELIYIDSMDFFQNHYNIRNLAEAVSYGLYYSKLFY